MAAIACNSDLTGSMTTTSENSDSVHRLWNTACRDNFQPHRYISIELSMYDVTHNYDNLLAVCGGLNVPRWRQKTAQRKRGITPPCLTVVNRYTCCQLCLTTILWGMFMCKQDVPIEISILIPRVSHRFWHWLIIVHNFLVYVKSRNCHLHNHWLLGKSVTVYIFSNCRS